MTDPFGMPTFVKVGKKKTPRQLGAPGNVRPPTEVGQATLPGTTTCNSKGSVGDPFSAGTDTMAWDLPANRAVGDMVITIVTHSDGGTSDLTVPSGWTELIERNHASQPTILHILYKVMDGTETTPTTLEFTGMAGGENAAQMSWLIRANGVDLSTNPPEGDTAEGVGSLNVNPPSISPTTGAGTYFVFAGGFGTDSAAYTPPSGYTMMIDQCSWPNGNTQFAGYQLVDITTSEDPGAFVNANGDITSHWMAFTIAMLQSQGSPPVAGGDHTHTEADVTDLDHWTEADHDALDHTGLTGVGASDHGALTGLTDDDHTQYTKADGTRAFTGTVSGITPTVDAHLATKGYVDANAGSSLEVLLVDNGGTLEPLTNDAGDDWLYVEV